MEDRHLDSVDDLVFRQVTGPRHRGALTGEHQVKPRQMAEIASVDGRNLRAPCDPGPGRPPLPGPGPPSVARCTGQCAGRDDGRKCRPGPYSEMADRSHLGPRLRRERPAPLRGTGSRPRGAATWRGPRWDARAVPPPSDAGPAPTASTNGGTYTHRYRDQKHVNELGHRKLPVGVVPAP